MIGQCLGAWLTYIHGRRVKHQMRGIASEHHNLMLAVKTFSCWKDRYFRARQLAEFQELVYVKGQLATLRRALWKWKFCILHFLYMCLVTSVTPAITTCVSFTQNQLDITMKQYRSHQKKAAIRCYSLTLKSKVVLALQSHTSMQRRQAVNNYIAQQFHIRKVLFISLL